MEKQTPTAGVHWISVCDTTQQLCGLKNVSSLCLKIKIKKMINIFLIEKMFP